MLSVRLVLIALMLSSVIVCFQPACGPMDRYLVLSALFDDVPRPGVAPPVGYAAPFPELAGADEEARAQKAALASVSRSHPPYREHRCDRCHNLGTGDLWRTGREGLCMSCHRELTKPLSYLHGPVAINDCMVCHHHHGSARPYMLQKKATTLCLQCHKREQLLTCPGRDPEKAADCADCHDPHGGMNRLFLKRSDN